MELDGLDEAADQKFVSIMKTLRDDGKARPGKEGEEVKTKSGKTKRRHKKRSERKKSKGHKHRENKHESILDKLARKLTETDTQINPSLYPVLEVGTKAEISIHESIINRTPATHFYWVLRHLNNNHKFECMWPAIRIDDLSELGTEELKAYNDKGIAEIQENDPNLKLFMLLHTSTKVGNASQIKFQLIDTKRTKNCIPMTTYKGRTPLFLRKNVHLLVSTMKDPKLAEEYFMCVFTAQTLIYKNDKKEKMSKLRDVEDHETSTDSSGGSSDDEMDSHHKTRHSIQDSDTESHDKKRRGASRKKKINDTHKTQAAGELEFENKTTSDDSESSSDEEWDI